MKKNNTYRQIAQHMIALVAVMCFIACNKDTEEEPQKFLIEYGTIEKTDEENYTILLDKGDILLPTENIVPGRTLKNNMRVDIDYTILEEAADTCKEDYYVRINYLNEIPTWSIIPYTSSIEDSIGNDPVQIINTQIANGFITIEFYYETSALSDTHNFSLVMHPATSSSNNIQLEFRHNAHGDKGTNKFGHVCFRLQEALLDKQGLIKLRIKYNDFNGPKDIDLTYNSPQMGDTNFTPQPHFSR